MGKTKIAIKRIKDVSKENGFAMFDPKAFAEVKIGKISNALGIGQRIQLGFQPKDDKSLCFTTLEKIESEKWEIVSASRDFKKRIGSLKSLIKKARNL